MRIITLQLSWLVGCASVISMAQCLYSGAQGYRGKRWTIFVNCSDGSDVKDCGMAWSSPCKTLQYVITTQKQELNNTHVEINIASGDCSESGVLRLDSTKMKHHYWSFVGSNETSKSSTIVDFSMVSFDSVVSFSRLAWRNSSSPISFDFDMSAVTFDHCSLEDVHLQFSGLNTNLVIQNTAVTYCSSRDADIPLFFLQTLYNYDASIFIRNSTFSHNTGPIIYAMQFQQIMVEDIVFYKNQKHDISNSSLVTVSGSSVILKNSVFNHTLGTSVEVQNVKNFTVRKVLFLSNNGSPGSCLLIKTCSNVSVVGTIFKQNGNPVIFIKDNDRGKVLLETCNFDCNKHGVEKNLPFLVASDGPNITIRDYTTAKSCSVHCKNGELVKLNLYCEKCKSGSFSYNQSNVILSNSCQSCPVGKYASDTGRTNCTPCAAGTYAKKTGLKGCTKCANDFFTSDAGAKHCSKMTVELIVIVAAATPLILVPLLLLLGQHLQKKSAKLDTQLHGGKKYGRLQLERNVSLNTNVVSKGLDSSYKQFS